MSRTVIAVVEGQTEGTFVREVLAPWLGSKGVMLTARLVGKPGHKGGVGSYSRARRDIVSLLKQQSNTYITTMFDYYAMPTSWPGRVHAGTLGHEEKAKAIEVAVKKDICAQMGESLDARRLIPYVQMHEFEALLFSEPSALSRVMRQPAAEVALRRIRAAFSTPEEINDNPTNAPSKRIMALFRAYRKPLHGTLAAAGITVEVMREECPHFSDWVSTMEALGSD